MEWESIAEVIMEIKTQHEKKKLQPCRANPQQGWEED